MNTVGIILIVIFFVWVFLAPYFGKFPICQFISLLISFLLVGFIAQNIIVTNNWSVWTILLLIFFISSLSYRAREYYKSNLTGKN